MRKMKTAQKRQVRNRYKVFKITNCPYVLSVKKSNKYLYLQLDRTEDRKTVFSLSSKKMTQEKPTVEVARKFGVFFTEQMKKLDDFKKAMPTITYDRSGYAYHGKIKAIAEGARESGLRF